MKKKKKELTIQMELISRPTQLDNQTSSDGVRIRLTMNLTSFSRNLIKILTLKEKAIKLCKTKPLKNKSG